MSRPREYDRDEALDAAMNAFWRNGYERTSYPVLETEMKMNRGSIYAAFGDKSALFYESLDRYIDQRNSRFEKILNEEGKSLKDRIDFFFSDLIDFHLGQGEFCGCMLANSAVELGPFDQEANEKIWQGFLKAHQIIKARIELGQQQGELSAVHNADALASFVVNSLIGIRVTVRVHTDRKWLEAVKAQLLRLFEHAH